MKNKEVLLPNNETIHYFEQGDSKDTLLLIHGNTSSAIFFEPLFEKLPNGLRVIAPDLRGFGNSTYNNNIETLTDFSDDLKMFLDVLGINHVHIVGWSLGGNIAMEFSSNYPNMVNSLVLLSSGSPKGYPVFVKNEKGQPDFPNIYKSKSEMALDPVQVLPLLNIYKEKNAQMLAYIYDVTIYTGKKPNKDKNLLWMQEAIKQRNLVDVDWALANFNITNQNSLYSMGNNKISKLKAKTLIIWGNKDLTVPKIMFDETVSLFPEAEVIIYENCGHSIVVDDPERLAIDILHFI